MAPKSVLRIGHLRKHLQFPTVGALISDIAPTVWTTAMKTVTRMTMTMTAKLLALMVIMHACIATTRRHIWSISPSRDGMAILMRAKSAFRKTVLSTD